MIITLSMQTYIENLIDRTIEKSSTILHSINVEFLSLSQYIIDNKISVIYKYGPLNPLFYVLFMFLALIHDSNNPKKGRILLVTPLFGLILLGTSNIFGDKFVVERFLFFTTYTVIVIVAHFLILRNYPSD